MATTKKAKKTKKTKSAPELEKVQPAGDAEKERAASDEHAAAHGAQVGSYTGAQR
jgi:hypothetical protein